jgi:general secretion pathway protein N
MTRLGGLNPFLLVAALLLGALVISLLNGAGRQPPALSPVQPLPWAQAAPPPALAPVPLQSLAQAWQRPLFSTDRSPDLAPALVQPGADVSGLLLTGVMVNGKQRIALFKQADGRTLAVREGATLGGDWRVARIAPREVELSRPGSQQTLQLVTPRLPAPPTRRP